MKKVVLLIFTVLLLASCAGKMKDIRIGESYVVIVPDEVVFSSEPSAKAEGYYLDEALSFEVVDAVCEKGVSLINCGWEMAAAMDNPVFFKVRWMKVLFETGKEAYLNGLYFFPELAVGLTPEEYTIMDGFTAKEYAAQLRVKYAEARRKDREIYERQKANAKDLEEKRQAAIEAGPWSEEEKRRMREHMVWIGMTSEQMLLSIYKADSATRTTTSAGVYERWTYSNTVYELNNGKLVRINEVAQ